jgi:dolichol-phosphate mannosyltransferase
LKKSIASRLGNMLIRLSSGVPVHDFTTALRAIRREVVKNVKTESKGNSFFMEFIVKAYRKGYTLTEVPIVLRDRVVGKSKLSLGKQSFKMIADLVRLSLKA